MEIIVGILLGLGLSVAVGFRIFVPFLVMSIAAKSGMVGLGENFEWIGSTTALIVFGSATILEVLAYFIPWLDNALDSLTTPAAFIGGTILMGSQVTEFDPLFQWVMAIIAGGGTAGTVKSLNTTTRLASTVTTGGLANPAISTGEVIGSVVMSILAIVLPWVAGVLAVLLLLFLISRFQKFRNRKAVS